MSSPSILILGAAGYIGGTVLTVLLKSHAPASITALVRTADQQAKLAPLGITVVLGTTEDIPLLTALAAASDVVFNFAVPFQGGDASIQAIVDALTARAAKREGGGAKPVLIQSSSTIAIMFGADGEAGSSDWTDTDYDRWEALPDSTPFHSGDKILAKAAVDGLISAYIVMAPCVYGVGSGPGHNQPRQMPAYLRWARKTGRAAYIGKGENIWGYVHISDLARLHLAVLAHALAHPALTRAAPASHGWANLLYAGVGTQAWKPLIVMLGDLLAARGAVAEGGAVSIAEGVSDELYMFGGNSYMAVSEKARALGWAPREMAPEALMRDAMTRK